MPLNSVPITATGNSAPPGFDPGRPPSASATPREYLTWVLDVLQAIALNQSRVDWPAVRADAFASIENATATADTYPAIRRAIDALGDPHTFFLTPEEAEPLTTGGETAPGTGVPTPSKAPRPDGHLIEPAIGYLTLPGIPSEASGYARHGAGLLREIDRSRPVAWIVDLRENGGGDNYPMLDVVAPLLGDGLLSTHAGVGFREEVHLRRGVLTVAGEVVQKDRPANPVTGAPAMPDYVTHNDYVPHHPQPPVAVLTGEYSASAGEAVLVAFLGRPRTRTFGEKTAGSATGNLGFWLGDGALLAVTVSATEDRIGRRYDGTPIPPDVLVDFNNESEITGRPDDDPVVRAAVQWLDEQSRPGPAADGEAAWRAQGPPPTA